MRRSSPILLLVLLAVPACATACDDDEVVEADRAAYVERHNALAEAHKAHTWERPPSPDGQPLAEGPAHEPYRQAWEACPKEAAKGITEPLTDALGDLRAHDPREGAEAPPEGCEGLPEAPGLGALTPEACAALSACAPAFPLLSEGSRRQGAASPLAAWDEWTFRVPGEMRSRQRFIDLAKLMWLDGWLRAAAGGTLDPYVEALMVGSRLGADLRNGADLGPMVAGEVIRQVALDQVRALLEAADLDTVALATLADGLRWSLDHPDPWPANLQANALHTSSMLLMRADGEVTLLPSENLATAEARFLFNEHSAPREAAVALERLWPAWERLMADLGGANALADRLPAYAAFQKVRREVDGLQNVAEVHLYKYDLYTTAVDASTCLTLIQIAARLHAADGAAPPESLADLQGSLPEACLRDPLTGEPHRLRREGEDLVVESPAREPAFFGSVPTPARRFVPGLYGRLLVRWRAPVPEPFVGPPWEGEAP